MKTSCGFSTSDDEQLKLRFIGELWNPKARGRENTSQSLAEHLGEKDNLIPFAHKQINLLGTGNQLTRDTAGGKEGIRLSFLSTSFQKFIHL